MRLPATAKWIGLALLGLVIAAAVAIAASNLVSQQIGIASESVSAGDKLAPAIGAAGNEGKSTGGTGVGGGERSEETTGGEEQTTTTPTPPPTTTVPTQPSEESRDDSGGGHDGSDD